MYFYKLRKFDKEMSKINRSKNRNKVKILSMRDLERFQLSDAFETLSPPFPDLFFSKHMELQYDAKIFKSQVHAHESIFAIVLLMISFQNKKSSSPPPYIESIYQLLDKSEFDLIIPPNSVLGQESQANIKFFLCQFLNQVTHYENSIFDSIKKYPLIIQILLIFFRTLLIYGQVCREFEEKLKMREIYQFFSSYFEVEATVTENNVYIHEIKTYIFETSRYEILMFHPKSWVLKKKGIERSLKMMVSNQASSLFQISEKSLKIPRQTISSSYKGSSKFTKKSVKKVSIQEKTIINELLSSRTPSQTRINSEFNKQEAIQSLSLTNLPKQTHSKGSSHQKYRHSVFFQLEQEKQDNQSVQKQSDQRKSHYRNKSENLEVRYQQNQLWHNTSKQNKNIRRSENFQIKKTNDGQYIFYKPLHIKKLNIASHCESEGTWVSKNVSKEFTDSFILNQIKEPYRTAIKIRKQKAREIRKSAEVLFI